MSDLFCAATLLIARHGDAEYVETWFSDEGGWLNVEGREQAQALAEQVARRRVARIWSSDTARAVQTAEVVAANLGLVQGTPVVTRKSLREVDAGDLAGRPFDAELLRPVTDRWFAGDLDARFPAGESGREVVGRYSTELREIADQHRGETVLVVVHQTAVGVTLPELVSNISPAWADSHPIETGDLLELQVDADGWRLLSGD